MKIRIIVLFSLIAFLLYLCSFDGGILNRTVLAQGDDEGSTIGGVPVEGLNKDDMIAKVAASIEEWSQQEVVIQGGGMTLSIPTESFAFDVQASVEQYTNSTAKSWYAFLKKVPTVHIPLVVAMDAQVKDKVAETSVFETDETYNLLVEQVSQLVTSPIDGVVIDQSLIESERLAFSIIELTGETVGLSNLVNDLNDRLIGNDETFSLLSATTEIDDAISEEALNIVASMLYSIVLQTDYEIIERHSQTSIPSYSTAGIEAKVSRALKEDLQFVNVSTNPAKLKVTIEDSKLLIELYSLPNETKAMYRVVEDAVIQPRTIYRYSSELAIGEEKLVRQGASGVRVSVYRVISDKIGPYEEESLIARDFYPPVHQIIMKSSKQSITANTNPTESTDLGSNELPEAGSNGEGYTDDENREVKGNGGDKSVSETIPTLDNAPEGSYFDKGGNLIVPTKK